MKPETKEYYYSTEARYLPQILFFPKNYTWMWLAWIPVILFYDMVTITILSGKARNKSTVSGVQQNPEARVFRGHSSEGESWAQASKPAGYFRCHKQVCIYSYFKELGKSWSIALSQCHPKKKEKGRKEKRKKLLNRWCVKVVNCWV